MSATDTLQNRNKSIIERRYISNTLEETGDFIDTSQQRLFNNFNFNSNDIRSKRSFIVTNDTLEFTHLLKERFIDMKRLNGRDKKRYPIHNTVVIGYYNRLIRKLHFGLTQDVRASIANQLNIEA